ncbi:MAG: hypothetical protein R6W73_01015 [Candidatus Saliniplasma sp.]
MVFKSGSEKKIKEIIKKYPQAENIDHIKSTFTEKDWKTLENKLNSRTHFKIIAVGYIILFSSLFIGMIVSEDYFIFLIPGLLLAKLPLYVHFKKKKIEKFVKNIVEYELTTDKTVMPPQFKIKSHDEVPYRKKPNISEDRLKRLVKAEKIRKSGIVGGLILLIVSVTLVVLLSGPLELSFLTTAILFLSPQLIFLAFFVILVIRTNELNAIQKYEEMTGDKVIPERYKSKIE